MREAGECVSVFVRLRPARPRPRGEPGTPTRSCSASKGSAQKASQSLSAGKRSCRAQPAPPLFARDSPTALVNARTGDAHCFDGVFGPGEDNASVFARVLQPALPALLCGTNLAVFMYGQTNSGKTFTMKGDGRPGLLQLSLRALFALIEAQTAQLVRARLSYVEVYNEKVFDLLNEGGQLELREREGALQLGAREAVVADAEAALRVWAEGERLRHVAATTSNARSSRSHVLLLLSLDLRERSRLTEQRRVQLLLADLAGSENAGRQLTDPSRFKEGTVINKSLLALSSLIMRLRAGREGISFRESKLTRMLQSALGGNCLTSVVCTLSADADSYAESVSTLRFAAAVGGIRTSPRVAEPAPTNLGAEEAEELTARLREAQEAGEALQREKVALERRVELLGARGVAAEAELVSVKELVSSLEALNAELSAANSDLAATLETLSRREQTERKPPPSAAKATPRPREGPEPVVAVELERRLAAAEALNRDYQTRLQVAQAFRELGPPPLSAPPPAKKVNNSPSKEELKRWNADLRRKLARVEEAAEQQLERERRLRAAAAEREGRLRELAGLRAGPSING